MNSVCEPGPVVLQQDHLNLLERLSVERGAPVPWDSDEILSIRSFVKQYYIEAQNRRCCYCREKIRSSDGRMWDLEHVVPRVSHPHFAFEPANLAISCIDCNKAKRDTQTLVNPRLKRYPKDPQKFKIVHPHLDEWSIHLARLGVLFFPKSEKGIWTIKECNLLRFAEEELNWSERITSERFEGEVSRLMHNGPNAAEALQVIIVALAQSER